MNAPKTEPVATSTTVAPLTILVDTREQVPPKFSSAVVLQRATLAEGDYTTPRLLGRAAIERKSAGDFLASITHGRERFERELERLRSYAFRAIVVESSLDVLMRHGRVHPNSVLGTVAAFVADGSPVVFAEDAMRCGVIIEKILHRLDAKAATS